MEIEPKTGAEQEQLTGNPLARFDIVLMRHQSIILPTARDELRKLQQNLKRELRWRQPSTAEDELDAATAVFNPNHRAFPIPLDIASRVRFSYDNAKTFDDEIDELLKDFGVRGGIEEIRTREATLNLIGSRNYQRVQGILTIFKGITLEVSRDPVTSWRYIRADFNHEATVASALAPDLPQIPALEEEIYIEAALLNYYDSIDNKDLETVFSLFSNDEIGEPKVIYERGTEESPIVGFSALKEFYEHGRKIQDGQHTLEELVVTGNMAYVKGSFSGQLKDGTSADGTSADRVVFEDYFTFENGKVIHRITKFPGREI